MKTKRLRNREENLLKNKNFLNNQNYIFSSNKKLNLLFLLSNLKGEFGYIGIYIILLSIFIFFILVIFNINPTILLILFFIGLTFMFLLYKSIIKIYLGKKDKKVFKKYPYIKSIYVNNNLNFNIDLENFIIDTFNSDDKEKIYEKINKSFIIKN